MITKQNNSMTVYAPTMSVTVRPMDAPLGEWYTSLAPSTQADIVEMVNEGGYPLDDIQDFIAEYGEEAYVAGHYVTWCELTESGCDNDAIEAYAKCVGVENIGDFEDAFVGEFSGEAEFAEEYYFGIIGDEVLERIIEQGVVVDWQATWDTNLLYDFVYEGSYYFRR